MRERAAKRIGLAVAVVGLALAPRGAWAQFGTGGAGGVPGASAATASLYANPYTNPVANPFLNPYMASFVQPGAQNTAQNTAMYFFAAQAQAGGIGSGQLSGVRPPPGGARSSASSRAATATARPQGETKAVRNSDIPGGGAARYFGRSTQPSAGPSSYFNRSNPTRSH
jgi:hypothetical protein